MDTFTVPFPDDPHRADVAPDGCDAQLGALVTQRVNAMLGAHASRIVVEVGNRVVILAGRVPSAEDARQASTLAWRTPGVHDVCNVLRWQEAGRDIPLRRRTGRNS